MPYLRLIVLSLFFLSGATSLIYEILWVRLLGNIFGNTNYATATVLAVFMAGLGFGSYFLGRLADRMKQHLLLYGVLEIGIGLYAALTFVLGAMIMAIYVAVGQQFPDHLLAASFARVLLAIVLFFIPTFLMGATLPLLLRFYTHSIQDCGKNAGLLYGINTAGAVTGTLAAGFCLLPHFGMQKTLFATVLLNILIGVVACLLGKSTTSQEALLRVPGRPGTLSNASSAPAAGTLSNAFSAQTQAEGSNWVLMAMLVSGVLAMILEVGWTRVLSTVFGSSVYAFTLVLAAFLTGLALGAVMMRLFLKRTTPQPWHWVVLLLVFAYTSMSALPFLDRLGIVNVRLFALAWGNYPLWQVLRFLLLSSFMLIPAMCFGALFPLSIALFARDSKTIGRDAGKVYLFNTIGSIAGSIAAGFLLIPYLGIYLTLWVSVLGGVLLAVGVYFFVCRKGMRRSVFFFIAVAGILTLLAVGKKGWDPYLVNSVMYHRPEKFVQRTTVEILNNLHDRKILFQRDGKNSLIAIDGSYLGNRGLLVNGKPDASSGGDMDTQLFLGHLPHFLHSNPQDTLVIGYGSGVTLNAALQHGISRADVVEIEEAVMEAAPFFDHVSRGAYKDERVNVIINDARNHLLLTQQKYDVIISEPSNPWMAGVASLFTQEFYELVNKRLRDDGIFCQWLQVYSISPSDVQMVVATVRSVFPHVQLWRTSVVDAEVLILASASPIVFDLDTIDQKMASSPVIRKDLERYFIYGAGGLIPYFMFAENGVQEFTLNSELHTDDTLRLAMSMPRALYTNKLSNKHTFKMMEQYENQDRLLEGDVREATLEDADVLSQIGYSYFSRGKGKMAVKNFMTVLKQNPSHIPSTLGMARIFLKQKKVASVQEALAPLLDHGIAEAEALYGKSLLLIDRAKQAISHLEKAVELEPKRVEFLKWLGQAYFNQENRSEAIKVYQKLIDLEPTDLSYSVGMSKMFFALGEYGDVIRVLEPLFEQFPMFYKIYQGLAKSYEKLNQPEKVIWAAETLVKANPYEAKHWIELIRVYRLYDQEDKVPSALKNLKKIHPYAEDLLKFKFNL